MRAQASMEFILFFFAFISLVIFCLSAAINFSKSNNLQAKGLSDFQTAISCALLADSISSNDGQQQSSQSCFFDGNYSIQSSQQSELIRPAQKGIKSTIINARAHYG